MLTDKAPPRRGGLAPRSLVVMKSTMMLVPHATLNASVSTLAAVGGGEVVRSADADGGYEGVAYALGSLPFAVIRRDGRQTETSAIYLPGNVTSPPEIMRAISKIAKSFGLSPSAIQWQSKDWP